MPVVKFINPDNVFPVSPPNQVITEACGENILFAVFYSGFNLVPLGLYVLLPSLSMVVVS